MKRSVWLSRLLAVTTGLGALTAHAENLIDIYHLAEQQDPQYAAAAELLKAQQTLVRQARGVLLPAVDLNAGASRSREDVDASPGGLALAPGLPPITLNSHFVDNDWQYGVQLRQPLFSGEAFARYAQSKHQVVLASLQYELAHQDLILRTAQAYFDVLLADRQLRSALAERAAITEQLVQAKRSFEVGVVSITDVDDAQAAYDISVSRVLALGNQLEIAKRRLVRIIGQPVNELLGLGQGGLPLAPPQPENVADWVKRAREGNLGVLAQREGVQVASKEVAARRGAELPTLGLVAAHNFQSTHQAPFEGIVVRNDVNVDTVGLQFSYPLSRGGTLSARVEEAAHQYNRSKDQLVDASRLAELQASQSYLQLTNSIAQVKALEQAYKSSQTSLTSTRRGFEVGVRTEVDVLNAVQRLYGAERDLYAARYNYLLGRLNLQASVGGLRFEDVAAINALLSEPVAARPDAAEGDAGDDAATPAPMQSLTPR